jgi:hypothetical protein
VTRADVVPVSAFATPADWYAGVIRPLSDEYGPYDPDSDRWIDVHTLAGDGDRSLPALHRQLCDSEHTPRATAAMYLAGWLAGYTAEVVGLALATARAGFLVDPTELRWHLHPDGWPERIELGTVEVLVAADHAWAGVTGVTVAESFDDVVRRTVERLVDAVTPIIDGCRRVARVGLTGLWNEVGDGLVMVLRHHDDRLHIDDDMLATVNAAARLDGVPWRAHAELRVVDTAWGRACVGRKGGCCLAYKRPIATFEHDDSDPDPDVAEFRQRFPLDATTPYYCGTCSLRDRDDAEARQLFWFELSRRRHAQPATATAGATATTTAKDDTRSDP